MTEFLQYVALGLGLGAGYALLAQGVVVICRGSGVLNFPHGAIAIGAGYLFFHFRQEVGWAFWPAFLVAVGASALLGVFIQAVLMRRLQGSSALMRVIATLGVLVTLQALVTLIYGGIGVFVPPFLPAEQLSIGAVQIGLDRFILLGIA